MNSRYSWKVSTIAFLIAVLPQLAEAKRRTQPQKHKNHPDMFQVVEGFFNGRATPNAALKISVIDRDSKPISGATVKLIQKESGINQKLRATDSSGMTQNNAAKNYYQVEVSKPGYKAVTKYIYLDKGITERFVLEKSENQNVAEHSRMPASLPEIDDIK